MRARKRNKPMTTPFFRPFSAGALSARGGLRTHPPRALSPAGLLRSGRVLHFQLNPGTRCARTRAAAGRLAALASLGLDLDLLALGALGLGNADREDALVQARVDLRGVDLVGEPDAVLEAPDPARAPAHCALALPLLDLAGDRELVADHLDVHVLALDARELRLQDVRVVLLLDVHERRPARRLCEERRRPAEPAERLVEHPAHALVDLLELAQRLPPLRCDRGPPFRESLRHRFPPSTARLFRADPGPCRYESAPLCLALGPERKLSDLRQCGISPSTSLAVARKPRP